MNKRIYNGDFWPTPEQELLLKAAVMHGKNALDAWNEWKSRVDIDKIDHGSRRMLPLLHRNLQATAINDPLMGMFKGIYRRTWYENQLLFHNMSILLKSFHEAGIETLILKGVALVLLHYKDYGLRPMTDFDVLVHTEQASEAVNLLSKLGFKSQGEFLETSIFFTHGLSFKDAASRRCDLHWYIMKECRYPHADDDFWDGAVSMRVNDVETYALNPTDQLLHICVHGAKWDSVPSFRWIADTMTILNTSQSDIDWNRLHKQAKNRHLIIPLRVALSYLRDVFYAPIPQTILEGIQNTSTSIIEGLEYKYKTQNHNQNFLGYLPILWFEYLRSLRGSDSRNKYLGFIKWLQLHWGVKQKWQLPFYLILMLMSRIKRITFLYWKKLAKISP
jgi:hypothetical protein